MYTFLVADDHPLLREALSINMSSRFNELTVLESDDLTSTLKQLDENPKIDLVLLDLNMPGCEDFYGLLKVKQSFSNVPVIVISASDSPKVVAHVMGFGAQGFVPKTLPGDQIARAIEAVLQGQTWIPEELAEELKQADKEDLELANKMSLLTTKQFQVLKRLQQGLLNKQIADELHISEATVKSHISAIFRKLEVNTRTQAVLLAERIELE